MTITLTPAVLSNNPSNTLRIKIEFMHGDADGYSHNTFNYKLPEVQNKEELIANILEGISTGLDWMDEDGYHFSPFIMKDEDWNSTNIDEETGIPLVGVKLQFLYEEQLQYRVDRKILIGTVVEASEDVIVFDCNGTKYEIQQSSNNIAPESAIPIIVDGYQGKFTIDGVEIRFEGTGDHTSDNQFAASASIDEVHYFDASGTMFDVSGY